jgi:hypothetical protein
VTPEAAIAEFDRWLESDVPSAPVNLSDPVSRCWLRLANGWTVSISEDDTPPAICCLAAWRTGQDDLPYEELTLFDFGDGRTDCRCWTFADVRDALQKVAAAPAPKISSGKIAANSTVKQEMSASGDILRRASEVLPLAASGET